MIDETYVLLFQECRHFDAWKTESILHIELFNDHGMFQDFYVLSNM